MATRRSPATDHRPFQLSHLRAERDADADFLRALGHEEREQAVEPERRQEQPAARKCAGHQRAEPVAREALGDRARRTSDLGDREIGIEVVNRVDGGLGQSPSADSRARTASSRSPASGDGCRTRSAARSSLTEPSLTLPTTPMTGRYGFSSCIHTVSDARERIDVRRGRPWRMPRSRRTLASPRHHRPCVNSRPRSTGMPSVRK